MPTSSSTYDGIPVNLNARRRIMRAARLGTRSRPSEVNLGDAAKVVDAARLYTSGWDTSTSEFSVTVRNAWAARKA